MNELMESYNDYTNKHIHDKENIHKYANKTPNMKKSNVA